MKLCTQANNFKINLAVLLRKKIDHVVILMYRKQVYRSWMARRLIRVRLAQLGTAPTSSSIWSVSSTHLVPVELYKSKNKM